MKIVGIESGTNGRSCYQYDICGSLVEEGSYVGFKSDPAAWTKIADTVIVGLGSPNPT